MNFLQRTQPDFSWLAEFDRFFDRTRPTRNESVLESPEAYLLRLDLPGFAKSDVSLKVDGRRLRLTAETPADRPFGGKVDRQWKLGEKVDTADITAALENGVLEITIPKAAKAEPLDIQIN